VRKLGSLSRGAKAVIAFYVAIALILLSGFYLPGGIIETTPIFVVLHGNLVFGVLWYLTVGPFLLLISYLVSPPLHEQVYVLFPHENVAPILVGFLYLLVAYGLWKKGGSAWMVAALFALLSFVFDLVVGIVLSWHPSALIYWVGVILNFWVLRQLAKREVRELYGNPLKKLKDAVFKSSSQT